MGADVAVCGVSPTYVLQRTSAPLPHSGRQYARALPGGNPGAAGSVQPGTMTA